jgi:hypothetical protein
MLHDRNHEQFIIKECADRQMMGNGMMKRRISLNVLNSTMVQ